MNTDRFSQLLDFLERLGKNKIAYSLRHIREDTLMVEVRVPGEIWEVEFLKDDEIEIERFRSNGRIEDASLLDVLFAKHSADSPEPTPEEIRQYQADFFR